MITETAQPCSAAPSLETEAPLAPRWVGGGVTWVARSIGRTAGGSIRMAREAHNAVAAVGRGTVGIFWHSKKKLGATLSSAHSRATFTEWTLTARLRGRARLRRLTREIQRTRKSMASSLAAAMVEGHVNPLDDERVRENLAAIRSRQAQIIGLQRSLGKKRRVKVEHVHAPNDAPLLGKTQIIETARLLGPLHPEHEELARALESATHAETHVEAAAPPTPPEERPLLISTAIPEPFCEGPVVLAASEDTQEEESVVFAATEAAQEEESLSIPAPVEPAADVVAPAAFEDSATPALTPAKSAEELQREASLALSSEKLAFANAITDAKSEDPRLREAAAEALGKLRSPAAKGVLRFLCADPVDAVRARSLTALLSHPADPALIPFFQSMARKDPNAKVRIAALRCLYNLDAAQSIPTLLAALSDENAMVRRRAVTCLTWADAKMNVPDLILLLDDPNREVRRAVVEALAHLRSGLSVPHLIEALEDEDPRVRESASQALRTLTAQTIAFDPRGTSEARAEGKAKWKAWWVRTGASLPA
jgi:HEAT repeat protein